MKVILVITSIVLHLLAFSQEGVNFEHKKISKLIDKKFSIEKFELEEVVSKKEWFLNGKFFKVNSELDSSNMLYIGRVNSCRAEGCSIEHVSTDGSFEYFDYIIAFDSLKSVVAVKIFNYQASHGQEVTAKSWLKQFIGFDEQSEFSVGKQIDAISGATISVYAITDDVKKALYYLNKLDAISTL